jgi:DDE superfamily endonuclease
VRRVVGGANRGHVSGPLGLHLEAAATSDQDPEEVQEWLETTYPELEKRAETENAEIFWCDETGAVADAFSGTGYAKRGEPATVAVPHPHIHMNTISAISNSGSVRFMTDSQTMTAALFLVFLGRLLRSTTGKIILIVDRLRAHQAGVVTAWVADRADRLELVELPRSAPERNVVEYLNNDLKGQINAEGLSKNSGELRERIQQFLRKLLRWPVHVRSYFQARFVQYAAAK